MGQCAGKRRTVLDNFDKVPDTRELDEALLPKLQMHALLTKVKLKQCRETLTSLRVEISELVQFELPEKRVDKECVKWSVEQVMKFELNELQMRRKFLTISQLSSAKQVLATLRINLYLLAVGPYHQDFAFGPNNTRISFDFKLAQLLTLRIKSLNVVLVPNEKQFPGDRFAFTMQAMMGHNISESEQSYTKAIALDNEERSLEPTLKLKRRTSYNVSPTLEEDRVQIKWGKDESEKMPKIQATVPVYDLHSANLKLTFLFANEKQSQQNLLLESQCFVSINKLMTKQYVLEKDSENRAFENRIVELEAKNWNHGKEVGLSKLTLQFEIQTYLKQMQVCVRTEYGIEQSSPVYSSTRTAISQIQAIKSKETEIQEAFIKLKEKKADRDHIIRGVNVRLKEQIQLLQKSAKQSRLCFAYRDEQEMMEGQQGLISLGFKTLKILYEDQPQLNENAWKVLINLVKRNELSLLELGYKYNAQNNESVRKTKNEINLRYQKLIHSLLRNSLSALNCYNCQSQKQFAQLFCAIAYFRLPLFRGQILNCISRADDPVIKEWRGTQFLLEQSNVGVNEMRELTVFQLMFDWDARFWKYLESEPEYKSNLDELIVTLKESNWEERLRKRGGAYFAFIRYWVKYIQNIAVNSKYIEWEKFPGYHKIIWSFLVQLKARSLTEYSLAMKQAISSLLSNEGLLNSFVMIFLKKIVPLQQYTIVRVSDLLNLCFQSIGSRGRLIPTSFDSNLFLKAIQQLLKQQSCQALGKTLILIYNNFKLFPMVFRAELSILLLTKMFFRLFLHWSMNVRTIFHNLAYVRLYHEGAKPFQQLSLKDQEIFNSNPSYRADMVEYYDGLINMIQEKRGNSEKRAHRPADKHLHTVMKKNLYDRRRQFNSRRELDLAEFKMPSKPKSGMDFNAIDRQLMPPVERSNSALLNNQLKVTLEKVRGEKDKIVNKKGKGIYDNKHVEVSSNNKGLPQIKMFHNELVMIQDKDVKYVNKAVEEYHTTIQSFIKHIASHQGNDSVPTLCLNIKLDEHDIRPEGINHIDQW